MGRVKLANKIVDRAIDELAKGYRKPFGTALKTTAGAGLLAKMMMPEVMSSTKNFGTKLDWARKINSINEAKKEAIRPIIEKLQGYKLDPDAIWPVRLGNSSSGINDLSILSASGADKTALGKEIMDNFAEIFGTYAGDGAKGSNMLKDLVKNKLDPLVEQMLSDSNHLKLLESLNFKVR